MEIDQNIQEFSQEKLLRTKSEEFMKKVQGVIEKFIGPNKKIIEETLKCSGECFQVNELGVKDSFKCRENCEKAVKWLDFKSQVAFSRFDSVLNGCLHSCTKQRRKSSVLSGDVASCYSECLLKAEDMLKALDTHLESLYSKYLDTNQPE